MAFSMAGGGPSRPELNVTPLIDILLVLIIVFMVIVATSKEYMVRHTATSTGEWRTASPE
jgi:biopolymer transport protein ExbD